MHTSFLFTIPPFSSDSLWATNTSKIPSISFPFVGLYFIVIPNYLVCSQSISYLIFFKETTAKSICEVR